MGSIKLRLREEKTRPLVIGKTTFCSTYDFRLKEHDLIKAQTELKEDEHKKIECLRKLKEKLAEDEQLIFRTDDDFLLRYLRYQKFDSDKAYKVVCRYYSIRKTYSDCFSLKPRIQSILDNGFVKFLPYREEGGPMIIIIDIRKFNLQETSYLEAMQLFTICADIISMNPHMQINGAICIWDSRGLSIRHMIQAVHPSVCVPMAKFLQDCFPWRLKYALVVHCNKLTQTLYTLTKSLLSKKIRERMLLLGSDMSELHKFVNPVLLPKEYGGTFDETDCRLTDFVMDNLPYVEYERSFGYKSE